MSASIRCFVNSVRKKIGIGSVDAMRKNLFPDFHRMGLINRYNKDEDVLDPYDQNSTKKYVALTDMGLKFIESDNTLDRHYIFSKGINGLLEGRIDILLNIFNTPEYEIRSISSYEYMFFVSAIGTDEEFALTIQKAVNMVRTYRSLTHTQRRSVINALKDTLKPMLNIPKPLQRDFHNWHNKIQQIYHLLKQTIYFDVDDGCLVPIYDEDSESRLNRSISQKSQYFERHRVQKQYGFELHHVVPLSYSECKNHFKLLDVWENMVYIDGFTHAKITQKRSKNIIMKSVGNDLELLDYQGNKITLTYDTRVKYHTQNQPVMIKRNEELRMI